MPTKNRLSTIETVIKNRQADMAVVLEDIYDMHNAHAVFRTCDAFGIQNIFLVFCQQEPFDPFLTGKSSSSSANKWLSFHTFFSPQACLTALKGQQYHSYATTLTLEAQNIFETCFIDTKIALWFGNEHSGLSQTAQAGCDKRIFVPMRGMVQSLNISVCAAVCISEATRQREEKGISTSFSPQEQALLTQELLSR